MEKKFTVLRIVGTIWKILAWITLVLGVIGSIGVLLAGILGGARMRDVVPVPQGAWAYGVAGGIVGFVVALIATIIYFLLLYAGGELMYLLLAIEENTRQASQQVQWLAQQEPEPAHAQAPVTYTPPSYSVPAAMPIASEPPKAPPEETATEQL